MEKFPEIDSLNAGLIFLARPDASISGITTADCGVFLTMADALFPEPTELLADDDDSTSDDDSGADDNTSAADDDAT
jgi:hypothetical protein